MTAAWDQFALKIRNEPTCASQCGGRIVQHFVLAHEEQHRNVQRAEFVARQRIRGDRCKASGERHNGMEGALAIPASQCGKPARIENGHRRSGVMCAENPHFLRIGSLGGDEISASLASARDAPAESASATRSQSLWCRAEKIPAALRILSRL
jgi:hypothetical protein